jgi:hypothetical protein
MKIEKVLSLVIKQAVMKSSLLKARHNNLTIDLVTLYNEEADLAEQERNIPLLIDTRSITVFKAIEQLNFINTQRNIVNVRTEEIREQQGNACDIDNENQKMLKVLSKVCKNFASASKV